MMIIHDNTLRIKKIRAALTSAISMHADTLMMPAVCEYNDTAYHACVRRPTECQTGNSFV